jgi:hypothetical protein
MSLTSLFETTFAVTLTALEAGVNSPTFASTGCLLLSKKPSTAKLIQHLIHLTTQVDYLPHLSLLVINPAFWLMVFFTYIIRKFQKTTLGIVELYNF